LARRKKFTTEINGTFLDKENNRIDGLCRIQHVILEELSPPVLAHFLAKVERCRYKVPYHKNPNHKKFLIVNNNQNRENIICDNIYFLTK
jgi:hypothetical protein